ncbi:MAG TPA: DUF1786 family protein, partial [Ktedonobacterales bacterium]|nr:DUF1786 family protein [Ktedonobacterales bacterium]
GRTMGGGPSAWAARDHALAGLPTAATPDAARTLDDDLSQVERLGIRIVTDDEAARMVAGAPAALAHVTLRDFDAAALTAAFAACEIDAAVDLVAVAAFDHGAAPPGYSDRRFRFDYIRRAVAERPEPVAFSYRAADVPAEMTRLQAVARDAAAFAGVAPVVLMDSAAAAVAGALDDPHVRALPEMVVANLGNFHSLAFHLRGGGIRGLFEHHTGELTPPALERYLDRLVAGTLSDDEVFADSGHGALVLDGAANGARPATLPLAITGPRRAMLRGSRWQPYEAVPHGAMMLAGCFGLLRAVALRYPELAPAIAGSLGPPPGA